MMMIAIYYLTNSIEESFIHEYIIHYYVINSFVLSYFINFIRIIKR